MCELRDLMLLWKMIVDEWLGFEDVVNVVEVLLDCLVHMFLCVIWGTVVGAFICGGRVCGRHVGNMRGS